MFLSEISCLQVWALIILGQFVSKFHIFVDNDNISNALLVSAVHVHVKIWLGDTQAGS